MEKLIEALGMGEYGIYVWPSFAIAVVIILTMLVMTLRSLRQAQKTLNELQNSSN